MNCVPSESSESQLEKEFSKLPAVAGKEKEIGRAYQRLLREIEQVKPAQTRLKTVDALVNELEQTRRNLLGEISDIRSARTSAKQKTVKKLNKRLDGKLRISLVPDGLRQPLRNFLQGLPGVGEENRDGWTWRKILLFSAWWPRSTRKDTPAHQRVGVTSGLADTPMRMTPGQLYELEGIDLRRIG